MAVLNAWQKLTRVLPGKPFGNGSDGDYSSATIPTLYPKSCSGSASSTTLNADTDANPFSVGDVVMIHQTRGTGVGQWEVNRISSVGTDQYTLQEALHYTYTDSGASQAQVVEVKQYADVTVESGTWTVTTWDGNIGGIFPIAVRGTLTTTGTISALGSATSGATTPNSGPGYAGGRAVNTKNTSGYNGEGESGAGQSQTRNNNGGGGGGGVNNTEYGGGGGGHATAGTNGGVGGLGGIGGSIIADTADLTLMCFGGGGGGGATYNDGDSGWVGGAGTGGGGIIVVFARNIASMKATANGQISNVGGGFNYGGAGGNGAGGSILIVCETATLGSATATAVGGPGNGTGGSYAGAGGTGRIAVHHSRTVTGTTSPTFTEVTDTTLKESTSGMFLVF